MPFPSLPAPLAEALTARGYAEPTPVQSAVLAEGTAGRDLLVSARTGSGKTVAYGLALAPDLLGDAARLPAPGDPLALVIAPTRELALQVRSELAWLFAQAGGRVAQAVGGMDPVAERRAFQQGTHFIVGTPGRMRDHIERGNIRAGNVRAVVLDEADEMLDLGFRDELEAILAALPETRRTLMFSATVPRPIATLAKTFQKDALRIEASSADEPHGDIAHRAYLVAPQDLERAVVNTLRLEDAPLSMVFCATRAAVARLHGNLSERGFRAVALSGELTQAERTRAIADLRDGRARVCVATDVAARGLDLPELDLVIHAELPRDPETFQHRSGRTGRAGRKGTSVLLVPLSRRRTAERLLGTARITAEWSPAPTAEAVRGRDADRLAEKAAALIAEGIAEEDLPVARRLIPDAAEGDPRLPLAAALVNVLRAPLPAPEELAEVSTRPARRDPREAGPHDAPDGRGAPGEHGDGGVWFHLDIGRAGKADPKWLLPVLCRRGDVSRAEIGRIRILAQETQFEVAPWAAAHFAEAIRRPAGGEDARMRIEPMGAVPHAAPRPRPAARPASGRAAPPRGKPRRQAS
ncbi:DEAD/DEAH box helicase [Roseomonas sp. CCTCC AB2023176]|uniref:DEAD/DEAH box helicase n=1 Tax=Roseomonas sp. CCTCC AB2023176 TaxID=3342640 RepID=UPI0035E08ACC